MKLCVILVCLLFVAVNNYSQQRDSMYCYNVTADKKQVWDSPELDAAFRFSGMPLTTTADSLSDESESAGKSAHNLPFSSFRQIPSRLISFAILKSKKWRCPLDLGTYVFESLNEPREDDFGLIERYKSDFAKNVFWERTIGRSKLVMNGAKGFSDFFLSSSMGSQLDFVSPKMYRKCTVAYSTPLKWATLGAGVDFRSWAIRIFLVTW